MVVGDVTVVVVSYGVTSPEIANYLERDVGNGVFFLSVFPAEKFVSDDSTVSIICQM